MPTLSMTGLQRDYRLLSAPICRVGRIVASFPYCFHIAVNMERTGTLQYQPCPDSMHGDSCLLGRIHVQGYRVHMPFRYRSMIASFWTLQKNTPRVAGNACHTSSPRVFLPFYTTKCVAETAYWPPPCHVCLGLRAVTSH